MMLLLLLLVCGACSGCPSATASDAGPEMLRLMVSVTADKGLVPILLLLVVCGACPGSPSAAASSAAPEMLLLVLVCIGTGEVDAGAEAEALLVRGGVCKD